MKVVILCGGRGMRLRQEMESKPKPMVEIGGRPILWHVMKICSHYGFNDFILCLGYKGEAIRRYFIDYDEIEHDCTVRLGTGTRPLVHNRNREEKWNITLVDTGQNSETGARIRLVERYLGGKTFILTYGDGVANIDLKRLVKYHRSKGKALTITGVHPLERFGIMELDRRGDVRRFLEKPESHNLVNAGFMACESDIFKYIKGNTAFEREPLNALTEERKVTCFQHQGFWYSMDTLQDYVYLNSLWDTGRAPWRVWPPNDD